MTKLLAFLKSPKFMLVVFVIIAAAALALVAVGVSTHDEPGLMGLCWDEDIRPSQYELLGAKDCPEHDLFKGYDIPLLVGVRSDNPFPPDNPVRATKDAVARINSDVGFELLRVADSGGMCFDYHPICVSVEEAEIVGGGGLAEPRGYADIIRTPAGNYCMVGTINSGMGLTQISPGWALHDNLRHELGHCLGLAHDLYTGSIMYPETQDYDDLAERPYMSDSDKKLLRTLYAPSSGDGRARE